MGAREYERLPGRHARSFLGTSWCTLWLGRDHLLAVESSGYAEEYRRFYYGDIQAVTVRQTRRAVRVVVPVLLLAVAVILPLALVSIHLDGWWIAAALFISPPALLLALEAARGPRCVTELRTAVSTEVLPSLSRVRLASRVLPRIAARVEAAQGTLTPEQMAILRSGRVVSSAPPATAPADDVRGARGAPAPGPEPDAGVAAPPAQQG